MKKLISTLLATTMLFTATGALAGFAAGDDTAVATTTLSEQEKTEATAFFEELAELVAGKQAGTVSSIINCIVSSCKSFLKWATILGTTFVTGAIAGTAVLAPVAVFAGLETSKWLSGSDAYFIKKIADFLELDKDAICGDFFPSAPQSPQIK